MSRIRALPHAAILVVTISGNAAFADVIELRADYWCPFNCEPGSDRPGFMVEIATEALALYGHTVNYETLNWARSLEFVQSGRVNGVIGTDEEESPELVFGPAIGTYQEAAAFRLGETIEITEIEALIDMRIGGIKGYDYNGAIGNYVTQHGENRGLIQLLSGENALEQNLQKLLAGRIDLVPEERSVLSFTLSNMDMVNDVEIVLDPEVTDLFIAFSPALEASELYAAQLIEGVAQLKSSGRIDEIMSRYGLSE